jgi:hypothetical protein
MTCLQAIPQYTESEMSLSFNLFEGESNKPLYTKTYDKPVNQSAFVIEFNEQQLAEGTEYRF